MTLDCTDVARERGEAVERFYLPSGCCLSCHEDAEQGYHPLGDVELSDGRWAAVCCWQLDRMRDAGQVAP